MENMEGCHSLGLFKFLGPLIKMHIQGAYQDRNHPIIRTAWTINKRDYPIKRESAYVTFYLA